MVCMQEARAFSLKMINACQASTNYDRTKTYVVGHDSFMISAFHSPHFFSYNILIATLIGGSHLPFKRMSNEGECEEPFVLEELVKLSEICPLYDFL